MTRKKSNVKALALAVTCAILAGGGIGLKPVYAADATVSLTGGTITAGSFTGNVGSTAISDGTITSGTFSGTVTLKGDDIKTAIEGVDISSAKVTAASSDSGTIGGLAYNVQTNKNSINTLQTTTGTLTNKTQKINYDAATGTSVNGVFLKDKGISAADGNFTVDGASGVTVVKGEHGTTFITGDGITVSNNADHHSVIIGNGSVTTSNSVTSKSFADVNGARMQNGNVAAQNDLYVGYESYDDSTTITNEKDRYKNIKFAVEGASGNVTTQGDIQGEDITATGALKGKTLGIGTDNNKFTVAENGNTNVGGNLTVNGAASFTKETAFVGGIKTNKISENTDGEGVTVDGVVLKDGGITATGDVTTTGDIQGKDINATGALKGQTLGIGTNGSEFTVDETGNTKVGGTLDVTGATTLGSTLNVAGKTTLSNELQVNGKATFGDAAGSQTVITGDQVETGRIDTKRNQASNIGGVRLHNGQITAEGMTINGTIDLENLKVNDTLTVGINTKITEGTLQFGTADDKQLTADKLANINQTIKANRVIDATSATIDGVEINGGDVTAATGTIKGKIISDNGGATLTGGKITAKEGLIGNVVIGADNVVTGVNRIEAQAFKVDDDNYLNGNGIKANSITAKGGTIGVAVINETTLAVGGTKLDSTEGITTNKLKIAGMTLTGTSLDTGTADFQVNGVTFNQGKVTAQADKGFVAGTSSFKEGSLIVDDNNKLEATHGLTTEKATVKGNLDVTDKATFGTAGKQTTIEGDAITTDTLKANKLILGASGAATVVVDKDGSLKAANEKFVVDKDGALKAADGAFTVAKDGKTNFKKDDNNLSSINGGNIWAKATDAENHTSSVLLHDSKGLHVRGTKAGETSAFDFDAATGISTFTGQDSTTTTVNGSVITSTKATGNTGVLDGSNLTLTNGDNKTTMSAGKATFKSDKAGQYEGKETTIDGGVITTDTLNVQRINLGKEMVNSDGTTVGSNLSIDEHGNIKAAGGNFTVAGTDKDDNKGALHNEVGNTSLDTATTGASMKYKDGGVESKVAVEANRATVAAGDKASFVANADNGGSATITGGTQTVTTTDKGTVFENTAHKNPFVENGATNTIINGNEITTGKITTDQLVITGKGNADGNGGSIAFGGNGTIKSDINDGTNHTTFETEKFGTTTTVTNGQTTTENKVTAAGNSNTVTKDNTHKSEFKQGFTSIGGVVTNGTVNIAQTLNGENGSITNEVTDTAENGKSSKLVQNGTGLEYTDNTNAGNATRINSSDVSIGSATEPDKRINLSDLGQIDELDKELTGHDKYKDNPTAVGGINAEAAIRREEVARLDGRINDVNDRVNKVGAMAAAIASLKSIGYDPQAPSEFSIGLGQYKGETGVAMGFFHYPNKNFMINVSLSTAGGETMGGIGATWRFGHKSPQKLLEEQREEQAKKELAAAEKYQAAAKLAKEAQERAEYAAKLARQAQVSADNAKAAADATQAKHFG